MVVPTFKSLLESVIDNATQEEEIGNTLLADSSQGQYNNQVNGTCTKYYRVSSSQEAKKLKKTRQHTASSAKRKKTCKCPKKKMSSQNNSLLGSLGSYDLSADRQETIRTKCQRPSCCRATAQACSSRCPSIDQQRNSCDYDECQRLVNCNYRPATAHPNPSCSSSRRS